MVHASVSTVVALALASSSAAPIAPMSRPMDSGADAVTPVSRVDDGAEASEPGELGGREDPSDGPGSGEDAAAEPKGDPGAGAGAGDGLTDEEREKRKAAVEAFNRGRALYVEKRYSQAAAAFMESFGIVASIETLWAAANAYRLAGETVSAVKTYDRYFAYVDEDSQRVSAARAEYDKLSAQVGRLNVQLDDGVKVKEVRVDGQVIPLHAFPVLMVTGSTEVEFIGFEPWQRSKSAATVSGRGTHVITFNGFPPRPRQADGTGTPDVVTPPNRPSPVVRILFFAGVGLTAAAGIGTVVMGGLTLRERRTWNQHQALCDPMCPEGVDAPTASLERFPSYQQTTNVLIGVTTGLAVVTTVLGIVAFAPRSRARASPGPARAQARVRLRVDPSGVALRF